MSGMQTIMKKNKCCANCEYWDGQREFTGSFVNAEYGTQGKCSVPSGRKRGSITYATGTCPGFFESRFVFQKGLYIKIMKMASIL